MEIMRPAKSIKTHCIKYCLNDTVFRKEHCYPNCTLKQNISTLKKIKAWCKECSADHKPIECKGIILNNAENNEKCPLHPYRMGKNPKLKGGTGRDMSEFHFKKRVERAI